MESIEFRVITWVEDGWSEGSEEEDYTDDIEIAVSWLERDDCRYGTIYLGKTVVASKDDWESPVEFFNGWTRFGRRE